MGRARETTHLVLKSIGAFGVVLVGLVCILATEIIRHKRSIKKQALIRQNDEYYQQHGGQILSEIMRVERNIGFTVYAREEIEAATNGFDKANIIGEGGQGTVYKAVLDVDGKDTFVAVKKCKEVDESRRKDFVQELVIHYVVSTIPTSSSSWVAACSSRCLSWCTST